MVLLALVAPITSVPLLMPLKVKYIGRSATMGSVEVSITEMACWAADVEMPSSALTLTVARVEGWTACVNVLGDWLGKRYVTVTVAGDEPGLNRVRYS